MPWKFEFTRTFRDELAALPQPYQKLQAKSVLVHVMSLDDPRNVGGAYLDGWAYTFGSKSLLLCSMDAPKQTVVFRKVII